jgi:acetyltransferase
LKPKQAVSLQILRSGKAFYRSKGNVCGKTMATALGYKDSLRLLEAYGIETPVQILMRSAEHFDIATSGQLRFPVVLKAIPKNAGHKTEKQLVVTNIHSQKEVREAFLALVEKTRGMPLECFVLQEQVKGVELIVGAKRDDVFGQTIMFGMGGVYVELTADYSVRVCPIDKAQAQGMLFDTKAAKFFCADGFRGIKASQEAVTELLMKVSKMLSDNPQIIEMDLNPVIATPDSCYAVDARILLELKQEKDMGT